MNWYTDVLKKYAVFSGRARRKEYWMYTLFTIVISIILSIIDSVAGTSAVIASIYSLLTLIPSLAVGVRRLHDTGRSGWWLLIGIIPLVGWIILLVFFASEGEQQDNAHGPNPKLVAAH